MVNIRFSDPHSEATFTIERVRGTPENVQDEIRTHVLRGECNKMPLAIASGEKRILIPYFMVTGYTIEIQYTR